MHPTDKAARVAGILYLFLGLAGPFCLIYVPRTLIVRGDATATASKIMASEMLFRTGIVVELFGSIVFLFVAMALYRLLSGVNKNNAVLMATLAVVSVPISLLNVVNELTALTLLHGADYLSVIDKNQLNALAMLFLRRYSQGLVVNEILWGLWLFPFGLLVMRSGFLPRILGILLIVNAFAYPAVTLTSILAPSYVSLVSQWVFPAQFGELWIMLWLLIRGVKVERLAPAIASA